MGYCECRMRDWSYPARLFVCLCCYRRDYEGETLFSNNSFCGCFLSFFLGPRNGEEVLCPKPALHLDAGLPWCCIPLCSIGYLPRSLPKGHVPPSAVRLSNSALCRSLERDRWSSTAAFRPIPACGNGLLAKLQHQQLAEIHQQPPRL